MDFTEVRMTLEAMGENIDEAWEKIGRAQEMRSDGYDGAAEWYRDMAEAHLKFNDAAERVLKDKMNCIRDSEEYDDVDRGQMMVYKVMLKGINRRESEAHAMLSAYDQRMDDADED